MQGLRKLALALAFASSILLHCTAATNNDSNSYDDDKILNIRDCRERGFDPMRLACPTCDLLPEHFREACRKCCQSYLDAAKRRTTPYQAAVLVKATTQQHAGGRFPTELDMLLEDKEEWDKILNEKGGKERLQVMTRNVQRPNSEPNLLSVLLRYRPPVEVLLLDETLPTAGTTLSYDKLKEKATEIISLQGLSKDDIKDLLMTLLP